MEDVFLIYAEYGRSIFSEIRAAVDADFTFAKSAKRLPGPAIYFSESSAFVHQYQFKGIS